MKSYKVRELLRIRNGRDHKELKEGNVPVYGSGGIMRFGDRYLYNKESILLPRKGTLSNIQWVDEPFWTVDTIYYTEINENLVDGYFLYSYLINLDLSKLNSGTGVPSMTFDSYYDIEVFLPELSLQKQVSVFLKNIKDKIDLNNRVNLELESMAKTIYEYWFVQFDYPNKDCKPYKSSGGKMIWNVELKRSIPVGWDVLKLKDVAKCIMGQSPNGVSYNQDGIGIPLLNGPADYENGSLKGRTFTTEPTKLCQKDDMVLCIRATIGNLVYSEKEFCLGRGVAAVRPNESKFSELIYFLLKQEIERFKVQASGSIIVGITKDDLSESKCLIPFNELINSFHILIKPIFDKIRININESQKLIEYRDWLIPILLSGSLKMN